MSKPISSALFLYHEAVERVDAMYRAQEGEVTDDTVAAEDFAEMARDEALEAGARFMRFLDDGDRSIAEERDRLDKAAARIAKRREWISVHILAILDEIGAKSRAVGPYRIGSRLGSERVEVGDDFDLDMAPEEIVRIKPEEVIPEIRELDKAKAKKWLKAGGGAPGLSVVRGPRKVTVQ